MERQVCENPVRAIDQGNIVFLLGAIFIIALLFVTVSTPRIFTFGDYGIPVNTTQPSAGDMSDQYGFISQLYSVPLVGSTIRNTLDSTGVFPDVASDLKIKYTFKNHGDSCWVEGRVKNAGNRTIRGVMVSFTLLDAHESPVGSTYTLISDLPPGNVSEFSTNPVSVMAASATLQNIIGG